MLRIDVLTLFPEFFEGFKAHSMLKRAIAKRLVGLEAHNLRNWARDRHRTCDDRPFGGGPGMLMKPEPVFEAYEELWGQAPEKKRGLSPKRKRGLRFIYLTPAGRRFDNGMAKRLARSSRLAFLCGHYEGVDQRVIGRLVTDEISVGDYVLTGGELAAMVVVDAVIRHVKGVLGKPESGLFESFSKGLLEYPQYTRPAEYRGLKVPAVLLSGDHQKIERWRYEQAVRLTRKRRPDLQSELRAHLEPVKAQGSKRRGRKKGVT